MVLQGKEIVERRFISGLIFDNQTQPAGVDLTVQQIYAFKSSGAVDGDNSKRELPKTELIEWGSEGSVHLPNGAYKVIMNEIVDIPLDHIAIARPRSTLLRCGATVNTAVWDPGYKGRSEALLCVHNSHGIKIYKDAKLIQLVFLKMDKKADSGYQGRYQGENI